MYERNNLTHHYKPSRGWVNDPNGLVYFGGYYHVFYQHAPNFETPGHQPIHWGHARTKDFVNWEELPIALYPDRDYDNNGCWSGTAIEYDGKLCLFYASVHSSEKIQTVSVATSTDGINFEKYEGNPIIATYPPVGSADFRDPAVCVIDGKLQLVMATGNPDDKAARLLLYEGRDIFHFDYIGVLSEWDNSIYAECPSIMPYGDKCLLSASVCHSKGHYFSVMLGELKSGIFTPEVVSEIDRGPDAYAGQIFREVHPTYGERALMITWIPGWNYIGFAPTDVGCMSIPREILLKDGKLCGYPPIELRHLLTDSDDSVKPTDDGFVIERNGRSPVVHSGRVDDLKILRDGYVLEVFVNGGETVYSVLL